MSEDDTDFGSPSFNARNALYSPRIARLPRPDAPVHDNVQRLSSALEGPKRVCQKKKEPTEPPVELRRQFRPEQMPVQGKKKKQKNFKLYMERQTEGPMSLLKECVDKNYRCRVTTRGPAGVRGQATGFLVAFDKHWNMALVDVDESFERRVHRMDPDLDLGNLSLSDDDKGEKSKRKTEVVGTSVIRVVRNTRRKEFCERHVPQLLLRGEHVVMVQKMI